MASTLIYSINQSGNMLLAGEVRRAMAGAMFAWNSLKSEYVLDNDSDKPFNLDNMFDKVWESYNQGVYEKFEDVVLVTTFDFNYFLRKDVTLIIESMKKFTEKYGNGNYLEQIEVLEEVMLDENSIGVAFQANDIIDPFWVLHETVNYESDDFDEDEPACAPFNIYGETEGYASDYGENFTPELVDLDSFKEWK